MFILIVDSPMFGCAEFCVGPFPTELLAQNYVETHRETWESKFEGNWAFQISSLYPPEAT